MRKPFPILMAAACAFALLATAGGGLAATEKTSNAAGVVTEYSAESRTFSLRAEKGETLTFTWTNETKFNGVVARGAKVTVRYTTSPEGKPIAQTVGVVH
jgi:hypothetical protein